MSGELQIEDVIEDITGVRGDVEKVFFAADIGSDVLDKASGEYQLEWTFIKGDRRRKVTLPRAVFKYEREGYADYRRQKEAGGSPAVQSLKNFWLVEMPRPFAAVYGIEDFVLTGEELAAAKLRVGQ